jgi:hypothetical protein
MDDIMKSVMERLKARAVTQENRHDTLIALEKEREKIIANTRRVIMACDELIRVVKAECTHNHADGKSALLQIQPDINKFEMKCLVCKSTVHPED